MPSRTGARTLWRRLRTRLAVVLTAFAMVLTMLGLAPAAHADLFNSRQTWLRNATTGLFMHWGMLTSPQYFDCATWEAAVTGGGWNATYWVTEAQKLHASYITLATFHSKLGYARPWPSAIPGTCSTTRDFLGELLTAAHNAGLHVILYMTNDAQWHDLDNHEWMDSAAYSAYKGTSIDLDTQSGFGEFSYDNFFEVMQKYPTLDGFWIDNDNQYWLDHNLYQQIYQLHPNMVQINNGEDRPEQDAVSMENKTGMTPAYDMPQAYWVDQPRITEAAWKLPSSGTWWYDGSNSTVDTPTTIGRIVANAGASVKSLMDETPMVNGVFPSNQANFNNFINGYLTTIWPTINGVDGGGYAYGGMEGGTWSNGAYGYTTISKADPGTQYVHVITKPSGSSVSLRDNGYNVSKVTDFRTGATMSFSQAGGFLTISGITNWDPYDTVFTVTTVGRSGIYANPGSVTATATASKSGFPASNLVDGSYVNYWDNNGTLPVSITLDQGTSRKVQYLAVNQREWSVTSSSSSSARIQNYKVFDSTDGTTWTQVTSGTMPSARGVQFIDLGIASTRYVKLEVDSTWAASTSTKYYKQLRIDEIWLGSAYATAGGPAPVSIEAEASGNTLSGSAVVGTCSTCSGGAKVKFLGNNSANFETIPVTVATAGSHEVTIYAEVSGSRDFFVSVNGKAGIDVPITNNDWYHPIAVTILVNLNAGSNTLKFYNNSAYAPDLDKVMVS
jgi:alpha-L-fucosidase